MPSRAAKWVFTSSCLLPPESVAIITLVARISGWRHRIGLLTPSKLCVDLVDIIGILSSKDITFAHFYSIVRVILDQFYTRLDAFNFIQAY